MEEWRTIAESSNYMVSNLGRIKRCAHKTTMRNRFGEYVANYSEKILRTHKTNKGYVGLALFINGKYINCLVHRLVAKAFLPNLQNYPCINHKDEDRTNNAVSNLEWCSYQYNNTYGNRIDKMRQTNMVKRLWKK